MSAESSSIIGKVNRFTVFNAAKRFMEENGRTPTGREIARETKLSVSRCERHLTALDLADGLPFRCDGAERSRVGYNVRHGAASEGVMPQPVDRLMA